tara:strand:- start:407 stop:1156 length:750 start_codon:yes stop_codon:yes gene_type:complete
MEKFMKYILSALLIFSLSVFADENYKYEPEGNPAEYYIGTFNRGKDLDDLVDWYEKFSDWAEDKGVYDDMGVALLTPFFNADLTSIDVVWVNMFSNQTEQYAALNAWMTQGGSKLMNSLPVTNSRQMNTYQWVISNPSEAEDGDMMMAVYSDCKFEEGFDGRKVYDLYKDFAIYAQSQGDTVGRKMIFPSSGYNGDADFVRLLYTSSIDEMGVNQELFWTKLSESEASQNLEGFTCSNPREYVGMPMRG